MVVPDPEKVPPDRQLGPTQKISQPSLQLNVRNPYTASCRIPEASELQTGAQQQVFEHNISESWLGKQ